MNEPKLATFDIVFLVGIYNAEILANRTEFSSIKHFSKPKTINQKRQNPPESSRDSNKTSLMNEPELEFKRL